MYRLKLKVTKKDIKKCKEVLTYYKESESTFQSVVKEGLTFLEENNILREGILHYLKSTSTKDIDIKSPLKSRFYNKDGNGESVKIDIEIIFTI